MTSANGTYTMQVWNETPWREMPPPQKCTRVDAHGPMVGALNGEAQTFYVLAYITDDSGTYSGYTYFKGSVDGREGGFVMADEGVFGPKSADTKWTIVAGSGTDDLAGISGTGGFSATHGLTVEITLDYRFAA